MMVIKCSKCSKGLGDGNHIICAKCYQNLRKDQYKVRILLRNFKEIHCLGVSFNADADGVKFFAIMERNPDTLVEKCLPLNPKSVYKILPMGAPVGVVSAVIQSEKKRRG